MQLTMSQCWGLSNSEAPSGSVCPPTDVAQGTDSSLSPAVPAHPCTLAVILDQSHHLSEPWPPIIGDSYKMLSR